jgi:hypothetical protein
MSAALLLISLAAIASTYMMSSRIGRRTHE